MAALWRDWPEREAGGGWDQLDISAADPAAPVQLSYSAWAANQPWKALVYGDSSGTDADHIWWADTTENYTINREVEVKERRVCVSVCMHDNVFYKGKNKE